MADIARAGGTAFAVVKRACPHLPEWAQPLNAGATKIGRKVTQEVILRVLLVPILIFAAIGAAACSSQQLYASGQAQQRNECDKIVDFQDRQKCMAKANTSYETYQRQAEEAKHPK